MQQCPPPAAQPLTTQITILGMNRISRWHSRMCSRAEPGLVDRVRVAGVVARAVVLVARAAADPLVAAGAERPLAVLARSARCR